VELESKNTSHATSRGHLKRLSQKHIKVPPTKLVYFNTLYEPPKMSVGTSTRPCRSKQLLSFDRRGKSCSVSSEGTIYVQNSQPRPNRRMLYLAEQRIYKTAGKSSSNSCSMCAVSLRSCLDTGLHSDCVLNV